MNTFNFKVGLFALATLLLGAAFLTYLLYARGYFENTYRLQLAAASADGVVPGVPLVFSGIEIGNVTSLGFNEGGGIVIQLELPERHAKWLKQDSIYTLDKPLIGSVKISVDSGDLAGAALPENSTMLLLTPDINKEIPVLIAQVKAILANVEHLTRKEGDVNATLANLKTVTGRMTGEYGMLESILGSPEQARAVTDSLDKTRALMIKLDGLAGKMDQWLFAQDGVADSTRESLAQIRIMLNDAQSSLKKADEMMTNAVAISADVKAGTQDIAALRAEIDDAVRKANALVNEINKMWPFARDPEVKLP
ncbi:MAG: ABC transporter substrate-binding protein [Gammaproteobacteria bacterium]|nr:ABC transporter substrate-binding protein [Gammaproteobacteria bacterium]